MSKDQNPKDRATHRGRGEAPRSHGRGAGRSSHRASPREASQSSAFATQTYGDVGEHHAETLESVSQSHPFGPTASIANMNLLCSEFTPRAAPATNTSLPTVPASNAPVLHPESMRDKEHCGSCGDVLNASIGIEWWKIEHLRENEECRKAYRLGTYTKKPIQNHAPQMTSTSAWSQGASQPLTQPQAANAGFFNPQSNNLSTVYDPSAGYAAPIGHTANTFYAPSSYRLPPVPNYSNSTTSANYTAPPGRIPTGFNLLAKPPLPAILLLPPITPLPTSPMKPDNKLHTKPQSITRLKANNTPQQLVVHSMVAVIVVVVIVVVVIVVVVIVVAVVMAIAPKVVVMIDTLKDKVDIWISFYFGSGFDVFPHISFHPPNDFSISYVSFVSRFQSFNTPIDYIRQQQ
ncbi:hypothetical protein BOTCAL_0160g00010 [Botryotinia calthae]|uniref:Uncharacterized protein n=1 Tax=Botryotinia calthae TaxID=38488 RepID=A0A4Y8D1S3_9HELO|nr:hypothetical protein BOTCAL_0160g00010 [Botryotinia calthae]